MRKETGNNCYYLGKTYPLLATVDTTAKKTTITFDGKSFIGTSPEAGEVNFTDALKAFYIKASRKLIEQRLRFYQPQFKEKYKSFTIENDPTKWGSCSSQRKLTFHWKLIIFPIEALDYVIIHELCHLKHMNHDRSFWRLVGKVCPDYKNAMAIIGTEKTRDM